MNYKITDQASWLVAQMVNIQPPPDSIWLIGSRANERANYKSDTDLLVFGSEDFLNSARAQLNQAESVDCLVVFNGNDYQDLWKDKRGSLKMLKWEEVDAKSARYIGTKWVPDEEASMNFYADMGHLENFQERAIRIWP